MRARMHYSHGTHARTNARRRVSCRGSSTLAAKTHGLHFLLATPHRCASCRSPGFQRCAARVCKRECARARAHTCAHAMHCSLYPYRVPQAHAPALVQACLRLASHLPTTQHLCPSLSPHLPGDSKSHLPASPQSSGLHPTITWPHLLTTFLAGIVSPPCEVSLVLCEAEVAAASKPQPRGAALLVCSSTSSPPPYAEICFFM